MELNWIVCSERLPEPGSGKCLVLYLKTFWEHLGADITIGYFDASRDGWTGGETGRKLMVTHWMPLPQKADIGRLDGIKRTDFAVEFGDRPALGVLLT